MPFTEQTIDLFSPLRMALQARSKSMMGVGNG
jgi:hypothetical protein